MRDREIESRELGTGNGEQGGGIPRILEPSDPGPRLPAWAAGVTITAAHLASIAERAEHTRREAVRLLPGSTWNGEDAMLAELRTSTMVLCDDVQVLVAELEKSR